MADDLVADVQGGDPVGQYRTVSTSPFQDMLTAATGLAAEVASALPRLAQRSKDQASLIGVLLEKLGCVNATSGEARVSPVANIVRDVDLGSATTIDNDDDDGRPEASVVPIRPDVATSAPAAKNAPAAKKAPVRKTAPAKKAPVKKTAPAKKASAKKTAPAKKASVKRAAPAKKASVKKAAPTKQASVKKAAPAIKAAAPRTGSLAIEGYDTLAASQIIARMEGLSTADLSAIKAHESSNRDRRTVLGRISQLLADG